MEALRAALLAYRTAKVRTADAEAACEAAGDALRAAKAAQCEAYAELQDARQNLEESLSEEAVR